MRQPLGGDPDDGLQERDGLLAPDERRRLQRAIREFESTERDLNHALHGQERSRRGRADTDLAELVFKDIRVAQDEGA